MSLYLCVFRGEEEEAGIDVGSYADFDALRRHVVAELEGGAAGSRFPQLILHSDCDGEWSVEACRHLRAELDTISRALRTRPPVAFASDWQNRVALRPPRNALESFIDVDGEILLERLTELAATAIRLRQPILFQ